MTDSGVPAGSLRTAAVAAVADVVALLAFVLAGRQTHDEGAVAAGLARTAWPFLLGLLMSWLLLRAWRAPLAPVRTGLRVGAVTVALGMALRAVSGQGTALAFVIVAAVTVCALLAGWRALAGPVARRVTTGSALARTAGRARG